MSSPIAVAIVEDHARLREALATVVSMAPGLRLACACGSVEELLEVVERDPPDVALLDIALPGMSGIEGVRQLKVRYPALHVLMLTVFDDNDHVFEAICAGASGYLLKDTALEKLIESIRDVSEGGAPMTPQIARKVLGEFQHRPKAKAEEVHLSPREREILGLLADGHSYKTAAAELDISTHAVRFHLRNTYEKLHVHSKSEAVSRAFRSGLLS